MFCSFAFGELAENNLYLSSMSNILLGSFACPKETNQRKRQPQIFFGLNILSVAHALQLGGLRCSLAPSLKLPTRQFFYPRPPQTVMLTFILRFATSKMLIYFQKRFNGIYRLTAIWVSLTPYRNMSVYIGFYMASENFGEKRLF